MKFDRVTIQRLRRKARRLLDLKANAKRIDVEVRSIQRELDDTLGGAGGIVTLPQEDREIFISAVGEAEIPAHVRPAHIRFLSRQRQFPGAVHLGAEAIALNPAVNGVQS